MGTQIKLYEGIYVGRRGGRPISASKMKEHLFRMILNTRRDTPEGREHYEYLSYIFDHGRLVALKTLRYENNPNFRDMAVEFDDAVRAVEFVILYSEKMRQNALTTTRLVGA